MRRGWLRFALLIFVWLVLAAPTAARADDAQPATPLAPAPADPPPRPGVAVADPSAPTMKALIWNASWPTFRPVEYVVTGVAGAAAFAAFFMLEPPSEPRWTGGILFDDAARDALRLRSPGWRDASRKMSDVTALSAVVLLFGVDSLLIPLLKRSRTVAAQLILMNLEAFAFSSLVTNSLFTSTGRARPSYDDCQRDPSFDPLCTSGTTASFPSGHANGAFTAAGLSCAHHMRLPLYGGGVADALACAGSLTLAVSTAALRVMGDRHYVTDVMASAGIGFGLGFGLPTLLHYAGGGSGPVSKVTLMPMGGASYGLTAVGSF